MQYARDGRQTEGAACADAIPMTDIKMLVAKDFMCASREGPNLICPNSLITLYARLLPERENRRPKPKWQWVSLSAWRRDHPRREGWGAFTTTLASSSRSARIP